MASDIWKEFAAFFGQRLDQGAVLPADPFARAKVMPGTIPSADEVAMDGALKTSGAASLATSIFGATRDLALINAFIGYPALALLQQNGINQAIITTLTDEMMRKWVSLEGDEDQAVETALNKHKVRDHFRWAAETSGYQGGCMLFIDMGVEGDELAHSLSLDSVKIPQGRFQGFRQVEPYCITPAPYESANPLDKNYFRPSHWYVNGKKVHRSRFLHFAWNTPPVLLRPAYNFFGIPLPQVALPYITNFERSRDAGSQLVYNFSLLGLKTNLREIMQPGGSRGNLTSGIQALTDRCKTFLGIRNNNGMAILDKESEEFFQINTPLAGVEGLISQQLELISLISRIPVTKLFGTPPRGFNATGKTDERFFNDLVNSIMARLFAENFKRARAIVELSEFGALRPTVKEEWQTRLNPDQLEAAQAAYTEAQTDAVYMDRGAALPEEVRDRLNTDPASPYYGRLDPGAALPKTDMADPGQMGPLQLPGAEEGEAQGPEAFVKRIMQKLSGGGNG